MFWHLMGSASFLLDLVLLVFILGNGGPGGAFRELLRWSYLFSNLFIYGKKKN